jgi:hypothetical protein
MVDVLHSLLTNESAREVATVESKLVEETSAGAPWLNEA